MADDWGQGDIVVSPKRSKAEDQMAKQVMFSPESMNQINESEANPRNDVELDKEIAKAKDPKIKATLLAEKTRRAGMSTWGAGDSEWGTGDTEASDDWGKGDAHADPYFIGKAKEAGHTLHEAASGKGGLGVLAGIGDMIGQSIIGTGDAILQGAGASNPAFKLLGKVLRPELEPGIAGIAKDIRTSSDNLQQQLPDSLRNDPSFKAGMEVPSLPFEVTGINDAIKKMPQGGQDAALVGMAALPFLLHGRGKAGESKPVATEAAKADAHVDALVGKAGEAPKEVGLNPEEPFYVNSDGAVVRREGVDTLAAEKAAYEARIKPNEVPRSEAVQGELPFEQDLTDRPALGEKVEPPNRKQKDIFGTENLDREAAAVKAIRDEQINKAFDERNPARGALADEYEKAMEQRKQREAAADPMASDVDAYQPAQGGGGPLPMKLGQTKRYNKQGGAVNFGVADEVAKRLKALREGSQAIERNLDNIAVGQQVRLMNGKTATVKAITDGRYIVEGSGFKDSVPRQGIDYAYKPLGLNKFANKQRGSSPVFKDAVETMGKGIIGLGDKFKNAPGEAMPKVDYSQSNINDIIRSALKESKTFEGFEEKLRVSGINDTYVNRAKEMWDDKQGVIDRTGKSTFSELDASTRKQADDANRDADTFFQEEGYRDRKPKQDIGIIPRVFNVLNVQKLIHSNKDIGPIINWVSSKIGKAVGDSLVIYKDLKQHFEPYEKLTHLEKNKLTQVAIDFDGINNDMLKANNLQWPTADMLRAKGLTDPQIHAYQEITKALDKAWKVVQTTFKEDGRTPPPQIPGYFPHVWAGSYKVVAKIAGKAEKMYAHTTKWEALLREEHLKKQGFEVERVDPPTQVDSHALLSDIMDHLDIQAKRPLDKVLMDKIIRAEGFTKRGIATELLERSAGIGGHLAEEGIQPFSTVHNTRLNSMYHRYIEDIAQHYASSKIVQDVYKPFLDEKAKGTFEHTPQLVKTVEEMVGRSTGHNVNHAAFIPDTFVRATAKAFGLPPHFASSALAAGARFLYWSKLTAGSPLYALSQVLQPLVGMRNITRVHFERMVRGDKTGNMATALGQGLKEYVSFKQGQGSPATKAAVKHFEDRGITDAHQSDMIDPSALTKKVNAIATAGISNALEGLETRNRLATALMYYHYFKDVMPHAEALSAAATQMGLTMGEYAPHHNAGMFSDTGMIGKAARPFSILPNTYLGEAAMNVQIIGDAMRAAKAGKVNPLMVAAATIPALAMTGNMLMWAGATGMVGYADINAIVKLHNYFFPDEPWLEVSAWLRKQHVPLPLIYGLLGSWSNVNIGPSINMPSLTEGGRLPGASALANGFILMKEGLNAVDGNANPEEAVAAFRRLAPGWAGQWITEKVADTQGGMVPGGSPDFTKNTLERTKEESNIARATGKPSVTEQNQRDINAATNQLKQADQKWRQAQTKKLANNVLGLPGTGDLSENVAKILEKDRGIGPEIYKAVEKEIEQRFTSTDDRNAMEIAKTKNPFLAKRLYEIRKMLNGE